MIAVVKEKDNFTADLFLETPCRQNFSEQKSLGKKSARLLAEANNRVIHHSERASYCSVSFRAAKDSLLQDRGQDQHGRASNKIVPEITDIRCSEQNEHERLCDERSKKHRRSGDSTNKES